MAAASNQGMKDSGKGQRAGGRNMIKWLMSNWLVTIIVACIGTSAVIEIYGAANPEINPLIITAAFAEQTLSSKSTIELILNRPILNTEGALAVFIGTTDITGLMER